MPSPIGGSSRVPRTLRLASLPLGAAALGVEGAVRRRLGQDPAEVTRRQRQRTVARTRRVLGELKGGALKAGQLLSTVEALFPADPEQSWREALTSLQESNPGMPWADAESVLAAELGPAWRSGSTRSTSAPRPRPRSGRCTGHSGATRTAAGRTTRPSRCSTRGCERRCWPTSGLSRWPRAPRPWWRGVWRCPRWWPSSAPAARGAGLHPRGCPAAGLRRGLPAGRPRRRRARVLHATPRVLVQTWLDGEPFARVAATGDQAERDRVGELYQRFLLSGRPGAACSTRTRTRATSG